MNKRAVVVGVCAALSSGMVGVQALAQPSNLTADAVPVAAAVNTESELGALQVIANADDYMLVGDEAQFLRGEPGQGSRVGSFAHPKAGKGTKREIPQAPKAAADPLEVQALAKQVAAGSRATEPVLIRAYRKAAAGAPEGCGISPELLAGVGQVESGNVGGRRIDADNMVRPGIFGPPLTGGAFANIPDSDNGRLDGSKAYDRAVGPMQFIPTSWALFAVDGDGDGTAHPQNIFDATATAAAYLCHGGRDLTTREGQIQAVFSYNHSNEYVNSVLSWKKYFDDNGLEAIGQTSNYVPSGTFVAVETEKSEKKATKSKSNKKSSEKGSKKTSEKSATKTSGTSGTTSSSTTASTTKTATATSKPSGTSTPSTAPKPSTSTRPSSTTKPSSTAKPTTPSSTTAPTTPPSTTSPTEPGTTSPSSTSPASPAAPEAPAGFAKPSTSESATSQAPASTTAPDPSASLAPQP
ncbi:lytic transglycosylase domain-containing protein [Kribbia dieselivorans]|uniref:lytic transglycosylase domain-containing protein n=1 Tax=Kribbia dieselivorans TaxID=331526 RepID=UPI0008388F71|nr:lytic transglycosylase domain-containing protein [Kribbia dieselivorans]